MTSTRQRPTLANDIHSSTAYTHQWHSLASAQCLGVAKYCAMASTCQWQLHQLPSTRNFGSTIFKRSRFIVRIFREKSTHISKYRRLHPLAALVANAAQTPKNNGQQELTALRSTPHTVKPGNTVSPAHIQLGNTVSSAHIQPGNTVSPAHRTSDTTDLGGGM